jgi:Ca2+:H+ antiporter
MKRLFSLLAQWTQVVPFATAAVLWLAWGRPIDTVWLVVVGLALLGAVFASVHHAEVIAHHVGEPFGTLVLALAVTVIEVGLIVSIMTSADANASTLARDTVYATVMIVCNGVIGLCLLLGASRHGVLKFSIDGTGPALSVLIALSTLALVLPRYTLSTEGPTYTTGQLAFAGVMSFVLYCVFVFVQTVRHRDYFLPIGVESEDQHAEPPPRGQALASVAYLLVALVAVVGLAKTLSPNIQAVVRSMAAPAAVVGVVVALIVLLPETSAAVRAAMRNRMQTSLNLALGSALATIGLSIPAVATISIAMDIPLELGLAPKEFIFLGLTFLISAVTLATGRATVLQGAVHLVLFASFLFLAVVP